MTEPLWWQRMAAAGRRSTAVFLRDVGHGLLEVSHNMLALLGLLVIATLVFALGRAEMRNTLEQKTLGWLQERHTARVEEQEFVAMPDDPESLSLAKAMAIDPSTLNRQQAAVATWLSRRYRVAPEPVARIVQEAWHIGQRAQLDPTLILAIMAIESSFNPFAQSPVGAQGLMQVMTRVHNDKYQAFGGSLTAFDPVTNLRVGVQVLKECISRAGGLEAGLRFYVGAANIDADTGYAGKVLSEQQHLMRVAAGQAVSPSVSSPATLVATAPPAAARATAGATPVSLPDPDAAMAPASAVLPALISAPAAAASHPDRVAMLGNRPDSQQHFALAR